MVLKQLFGKKNPANQEKPSAPGIEPSQNASGSAEEAQSEGQSGEPIARLLEEAMIANARNDNAETRYRVYQELLFSELYLALAEPQAEGQENPQPEGSVNVAILTNPSGVKFAAAFTSPEASKRWRPEGGNYITIRGQDLYRLLEPSPAEVIVLNPGSAPFLVLPKLEYRQLAAGIVPQSQRSPVQMAAAPQQEQPQVAFPPDLLNDAQKTFALAQLQGRTELEAAAFGVVLPPGAKPEDGWIRTLFLRVKDPGMPQEKGQELFEEIQKTLAASEEFKDTGFQLVHVPDPGFWAMVAGNNVALFDLNPPPPQAAQPAQGGDQQELQIAFPPDVFTAEQKTFTGDLLQQDARIQAAAVGAMLPPGADREKGWVRIIFLRTEGVEENQESIQAFCTEIRDRIRGNEELFKETGFEVGVMPDPNFWVAMNREKIAIFDRNPPPIPAAPQKEGVVDANV